MTASLHADPNWLRAYPVLGARPFTGSDASILAAGPCEAVILSVGQSTPPAISFTLSTTGAAYGSARLNIVETIDQDPPPTRPLRTRQINVERSLRMNTSVTDNA